MRKRPGHITSLRRYIAVTPITHLGAPHPLFVYSGGSQHWEQEGRSPSEKSPSFLDHAPSAEVEITSYVLLALLYKPNRSPEDLTKASGIVQWIIRQQNPYGGFSSTQVPKLPSAPQPVLGIGALVQGLSGPLTT